MSNSKCIMAFQVENRSGDLRGIRILALPRRTGGIEAHFVSDFVRGNQFVTMISSLSRDMYPITNEAVIFSSYTSILGDL